MTLQRQRAKVILAMDVVKMFDVIHEIDNWNNKSVGGVLDIATLDLLLSLYLADANGTLEPDQIQKAQAVLGRSIAIYAHQKSPIYRDLIDEEILRDSKCLSLLKGKFSIRKEDLLDKDRWYTSDLQSTVNATSGTTGPLFEYKINNDFYLPIEQDHHYKAVLDEFGLSCDKSNILYMTSGINVNKLQFKEFAGATIRYASGADIPQNSVIRAVAGHGCPDANINYVLFDVGAFFHIDAYCGFVIQYCVDNKIDVILAPGGFFEILCTYLISSNRTEFPYICKLLSNTGDRVNPETLKFLVEAGVADHWCDHMRCWDGGAGFFTCKEGNYHLHEELAYVWSTKGKMTSIDFFNYSSPFINYANGDYCEVGNKWEKCDCGRWYRSFEFNSRRPRSVRAGSSHYDSAAVHKELTDKFGVKFVSYHDNLIMVEDSTLSPENKNDMVRDMAKEQIVVQFFNQPNLKAMGLMSKPPTICNNGDPAPCYCVNFNGSICLGCMGVDPSVSCGAGLAACNARCDEIGRG